MAFTLHIRPSVRKELDRVSRNDRGRVTQALQAIVSDPFSGKQLHGKHAGEYSFRVWPYRIIYRIEKKILLVIVIAFGHRQGVY